MIERSSGGETHSPIINLQRFAESKRDRLIRLGRERRAEARRLEARAKIVSQEARAYTRQGRPGAAAAARSEAADLRARSARQKELAAQYSRELAELRAERARERARRRAQLLREREARRRRKRVVRGKLRTPKRRKPVKRDVGFVEFLSEDLGRITIRTLSKAVRSRVGRYWNLVRSYLEDGDPAVLRRIEREYGGKSEYDTAYGLKKPHDRPPGSGKRYTYAVDRKTIVKYGPDLGAGDKIYRVRTLSVELAA